MKKDKLKYRYVFMPINGLAELRLAEGDLVIECEDVIFHPRPETLKKYVPSQDLILRLGSAKWRRIGDIIINQQGAMEAYAKHENKALQDELEKLRKFERLVKKNVHPRNWQEGR